jgi:hypothetical protein
MRFVGHASRWRNRVRHFSLTIPNFDLSRWPPANKAATSGTFALGSAEELCDQRIIDLAGRLHPD